uniref:PDZ domain-containing protein n=1 Tax=Macrostomum lignano TaxID=282301 RepID=A0A1I8FI55_9PLAT
MSLYPSLEDYKVDSMARAQAQQAHQQQAVTAAASTGQVALYPSLSQYMGLDVSQWAAAHAVRHAGSGHAQIAPVTQQSVGLRRAEIRQGLRPVTLCKGRRRQARRPCQGHQPGLFVAMPGRSSRTPLRRDQIVEVNGEAVAGWSADRAAKAFKGCPVNGIQLMVRDRPFERTVTVHKDSVGHVGFVIKDAAITALVATAPPPATAS